MTPVGSADVLNVTDPVNPPDGVIVTVFVAFEPAATVVVDDVIAMEKSVLLGADSAFTAKAMPPNSATGPRGPWSWAGVVDGAVRLMPPPA